MRSRPVAVSALALLLAAGCGHSCPLGTSLRGGPPPKALGQWCEDRPSPFPPTRLMRSMDTGAMTVATVPDREVEGEATTWYENGNLESFGEFKAHNGTSVPHGVWTFWSEDGTVDSRVSYVMGELAGCVEVWNRRGERTSHVVAGGFVHDSDCTNGELTRMAEVEDEHHGTGTLPHGELTTATYLSPSGFGLENNAYAVSEPGLGRTLGLWIRREVGSLWFGGMAMVRTAEEGDHLGIALAPTLRTVLVGGDPFALSLSGDLGAQYLSVTPYLSNGFEGDELYAHKAERFITGFFAVQLSATLQLSRTVALLAGYRLETFPAFELERETILGGAIRMTDTWTVGGTSHGLVLGLQIGL